MLLHLPPKGNQQTGAPSATLTAVITRMIAPDSPRCPLSLYPALHLHNVPVSAPRLPRYHGSTRLNLQSPGHPHLSDPIPNIASYTIRTMAIALMVITALKFTCVPSARREDTQCHIAQARPLNPAMPTPLQTSAHLYCNCTNCYHNMLLWLATSKVTSILLIPAMPSPQSYIR